MSSRAASFEEARVNVRLKISALWVAMLFLFAYGDIFGFFRRGQLRDIARGEISGIEITQAFLFAVSAYIAIASAMVVLTLVLPAPGSRWTNVVLAPLFIVSIVASVIGDSWAYFWFLSAAEVVALAAIAWLAWTWPRTASV